MAAKNSPQAVLGNRFIRVLWSKKRGRDTQSSSNYQQNQPSQKESTQQQHNRPPTTQSQQEKSAPPANMVPIVRPGAMSLVVASAVTPIVDKASEEKRRKLAAEKQEVVKSELEKAKELLGMLSKANIAPEEKAKIKEKIAKLTAHVEDTLQKEKTEVQKAKQTSAPSTTASSTSTTATATATTASLSPQSKRRRLANEPIPPLYPDESKSSLGTKSASGDISGVASSETGATETNTTDANKVTTTTDTAAKETTTDDRLEKLQKEYQNLEKMAVSLGIDTSNNAPATAATAIRGRGAPFAPRGRGAIGRGGVAPTMTTTTAGRGRGRGRPMMVLDNRTTTLKLSHVPESLRNDTAMRSFFQSYGTIKSLSFDSDHAFVQFDNRRSAEQAYGKGKVIIQSIEIPLSWQSAASTSSSATSANTGAGATQSDQSRDAVVEKAEVIEEVFERGPAEEEAYYSSDDNEEKSWKR